MHLRPLHDRVLIKPEKNPEQTESGLWLSEHKKPEQTGTVVAVGACEHPRRAEAECMAQAVETVTTEFMSGAAILHQAAALLRGLTPAAPLVKEGDYVVFGWNVGQEIRIDDDTYLLMRETDILCVLEGEPA